jgi:hypothetical protein
LIKELSKQRTYLVFSILLLFYRALPSIVNPERFLKTLLYNVFKNLFGSSFIPKQKMNGGAKRRHSFFALDSLAILYLA